MARFEQQGCLVVTKSFGDGWFAEWRMKLDDNTHQLFVYNGISSLWCSPRGYEAIATVSLKDRTFFACTAHFDCILPIEEPVEVVKGR